MAVPPSHGMNRRQSRSQHDQSLAVVEVVYDEKDLWGR